MSLFTRIHDKFFRKSYENISYSQCGEDLIIDYIFTNYLRIQNPSYLDIGAFDPIHLSNTYLFYKQGSHGVCVEPDPFLFARFKKVRKKDICLNVGVGIRESEKADFYVMTSKSLNTFSKEIAESYEKESSHKIEKIVQIPLTSIDMLMKQYFNPYPNFLSVDVEGLEIPLLESMDFEQYRPEVLCIETLTYSENNLEQKINDIIEFMKSKNYFVYADTYINTIFVDRNSWELR